MEIRNWRNKMSLISVDEKKSIFHLSNGKISYIFQVEEQNLLHHIYFGKAISDYHGGLTYPRFERSFSTNFKGDKNRVYSRDTLLQEYSSLGSGDFRIPSIEIVMDSGSSVCDFRYKYYKMFSGKKKLHPLPHVWTENDSEAETIEIYLEDVANKLLLCLSYTIYRDYDIIARSARLENQGKAEIQVNKLASMSIDLPFEKREMIHLPGSWGNERQIERKEIQRGIHIIDSKRGTTSHQENPFIALVEPSTTEHRGKAYGFLLIYSGNHEEALELDQYEQLRLTIGINPSGFQWNLEPNKQFQTPEVILTFSENGLNGMSQNFHSIIQDRIIRSKYKNAERPILINNWEATYFNFNERKIKEIIDVSANLGIELFVLDDGWFGKRDSDQTSLGDWYENVEKLPNGLRGLSEYAHDNGMKFGLWFEPEMISEKSRLFSEYPDWYFHVPGIEATLSRSQYVLDLSREDVLNYLFDSIHSILTENQIDYVKWDMNRYLTDVFSLLLKNNQQGEVSHRYVINLYRLMDKLTKHHPDILFEACSGGGGRFDAGMLYYMPQIWTSDNSDAVERLKIQYGTSLVYPPSTMGAHVSAVPNHQNGRITPLITRANVAMSGVFGYELDPTLLTIEEKAQIEEQIKFYKKYRDLLLYGTFTRLSSPFENNHCVWQVVSDDKSECIVTYSNILSHAAPPLERLHLIGLEKEAHYYCPEMNITCSGDELMNIGLYIFPIFNQGDFESRVFRFTKI